MSSDDAPATTPPVEARQPPARACYQEDDWVAEVEIVEDRSDGGAEAYTLRVIRTVQRSRCYRPVPDGRLFTCWQRRGLQIFSLTRQGVGP